MKVLLTGASGFLGVSILKEFTKLGYKVDTLGRSTKDTFNVDLTHLEKPLKTAYDLVVHAAGKAHFVPKNIEEENLFYTVNVKGTENLLRCLTPPPKYFVFISSVSVYGVDHGNNINENHPLQANTAYGKSKIIAERTIQDWAALNNVKVTLLRLPLLIGENPKGNLKTMINAIQKGYYFNIGKGNIKKSMVLNDDVVHFIPKIMTLGGIYNLTDGYSPSFKELSDTISNHYSTKKAFSINHRIIKPVAVVGDLIEKVTKIKMPINSLKLKKITKPLTYNDEKARAVGWNPREVLKNKNLWLK
ncbi:NAD-dependent epimerase/dehydratase family protein [Maribacter polysaccharolyticus]|uniref:NAD-dependent epimerase/dehydratase family protein n=1 Tax=Maribacter polysaccharolyticus TaxID=3020831 RepID=UPI00237FBB33|nr:NAD(P)-dependent oxidoreductase [Maribacter polysaccharolyticus]MDE3743516.1 NAD(P)-dependent oxidoreductase [Maribacter polysaccharolyticus]